MLLQLAYFFKTAAKDAAYDTLGFEFARYEKFPGTGREKDVFVISPGLALLAFSPTGGGFSPDVASGHGGGCSSEGAHVARRVPDCRENLLSLGRVKKRGAAFGVAGDGGTSIGFEFREGSVGMTSSAGGGSLGGGLWEGVGWLYSAMSRAPRRLL